MKFFSITLPTVYTDALSYYQALSRLITCMKEIVDEINEIENKLNEVDPDIINAKFLQLENLINTFNNELNDKIDKNYNYLNNKIDDDVLSLTIKINYEIANLKNELLKLINDNYQTSISYTDIKVDELYHKILDILDDLGMYMLNPFTGQCEPVSNVVMDIYNYMRYYCISCNEFDALGCTCTYFDNLGLTCIQFDIYSKKYLNYNLCDCDIIDPRTGQIAKVNDIIYELIDKIESADKLTITEFDALPITVTIFDNTIAEHEEYNAYYFDFHGKQINFQ